MIEIIDLKKEYNGINAIENINLKIEEGEIFGFIGSDGAGKTTILRILSGVLKPTSGKILIKGESLSEKNKKISYVPQSFGLYEELTLFENLNFFADIYGIDKSEKYKKIDQILNFLNLKDFKNFLAGNLSGGMKQKLSLGCALISNPEILILDEPTNGIDPRSRRDLWEIFYKLSEESVSIILSTSYFEEADLCKRIVLLYKGKILAEGNPEDIKNTFPYPVFDFFINLPKNATELIKKNDFVIEAIPLGDRVHIILKEISFKVNLIDFLKEKGFEVKISKQVLPSMEDVFIFKVKENGK